MAQRPRATTAAVADREPANAPRTAPGAGRRLSRALLQGQSGLVEIEAIAELMAAALDAADASIVMADARLPDLPLVYVSEAFTRLTGFSVNEAIGRNLRFLQVPQTDPAALNRVRAALATGERITVELQNRRKDKTVFWNRLTLVPYGKGGDVHYWIGVQEDVSQPREAAAGLQQQAEDRRALETRLRHTYKMQALGMLSSGIAHDINNLLLAMSGLVEMSAEEMPPGSPVAKRLSSVLTAIDRTSDIVRHILAFSRRGKVQREKLRLDRAVDEGLDLVGASLPAFITLRRRLDYDGMIFCDAAEIHLILLTLGANAMDAIGHRHGMIDVALERADLREARRPRPAGLAPGVYARLTFRDTGPGMTPEVAARAFDPLFTTKDPTKGAGMGLAIARGIAGECGGTMLAGGESGAGAEFTVYLPEAT
jgi:two-component system, cell cycle sensor histidine kinase and response regulator CckA